MIAAPGKTWATLPIPIILSDVLKNPRVIFDHGGRMLVQEPSVPLPNTPWEVDDFLAMKVVLEYPGATTSNFSGPRLFPDDLALEVEYRRHHDAFCGRILTVYRHPAAATQRDLADNLLAKAELTAEDIGEQLLESYLMQVSKVSKAHP